jgi:beta-N-acetylhexosaminidase
MREMRAVRGPFGIPEAAVLAVAAGTDLLCFGRDQDQLTYLAVRDALVSAVRDGRLPGARLEEAAASVAALRAWTAAHRQQPGWGFLPDASLPGGSSPGGSSPGGSSPGGSSPGGSSPGDSSPGDSSPRRPDDGGVGLAAARRAVRADGITEPVHDPLVIEVVPPANMAVGSVPWGLGAWIAAPSVRRISTGAAADAGDAERALAAAAGRSLVIVVRDAHRYPAARRLVRRLLAARPDAIVVEMGLPVWRPPAGGYVATYGAARTSGQAAAEVLGFARR